jgi:hypothetical protein
MPKLTGTAMSSAISEVAAEVLLHRVPLAVPQETQAVLLDGRTGADDERHDDGRHQGQREQGRAVGQGGKQQVRERARAAPARPLALRFGTDHLRLLQRR